MSAEDAKAAFLKAVQEAGGWRSLTFNGTTYLHVGSNADQVYADLVKKAIRTGHAIGFPNGSREFYEWVAVYDPSKAASTGYVWKKGSGDLCKHELVRTVVDKDNNATKTVLKTAWRKLDLE